MRSVMAEYARKFIVTVVVAAFLLGCWLTKLQLDVSRAISSNDPVLSRMVAQHEWMLNNLEPRISRLEQKP